MFSMVTEQSFENCRFKRTHIANRFTILFPTTYS